MGHRPVLFLVFRAIIFESTFEHRGNLFDRGRCRVQPPGGASEEYAGPGKICPPINHVVRNRTFARPICFSLARNERRPLGAYIKDARRPEPERSFQTPCASGSDTIPQQITFLRKLPLQSRRLATTSDARQRLIEIRNEVVRMLDSHGKPDQLVGHPEKFALFD